MTWLNSYPPVTVQAGRSDRFYLNTMNMVKYSPEFL